MQNTMQPYRLSDDTKTCIQNCQQCHQVCQETLTHCMNMGGKHVEPTHIGLMLDCIQICQISADFMMRGSPYHGRTCAACAVICEACADDCERIAAGNDTQMLTCVETCRKCAQSCREMSKAMGM